jgi:hypothetical protein
MDKRKYEDAVERLKQVNEVISGLDPAIRADAFAVLKPYVTGKPGKLEDDRGEDLGEVVEPDSTSADLIDFFDKYGSDVEANNAHAAAAWWYHLYGKSPFTYDDLRTIAEQGEVHIPDRLDNTIGSGRRDGRPLYRRVRPGHYRPTAHGESFLKTTFSVTKGRQKPPSSDEPAS